MNTNTENQAPEEQPAAHTYEERLKWLIKRVNLFYGIPGFVAVNGRTVEQRIKDCLSAIDAAMDAEKGS